MRIVFMGTPYFATTILSHLVENKCNIVGVVTAPDKPMGRGLKIGESSVKQYALRQKIDVLQPKNLKDEEFLNNLKNLKADLFVVVAFRMLPEQVWRMPQKGTINLHASLLPNYRGAAPIHWAIINGETTTGVTTFFIEKEIDTGQIIEQNKINIHENETVGKLHDKLMELGAKTTLSTIKKIETGKVQAIEQNKLETKTIKIAPKLLKNDCLINFNQPVENVHNFVRGLSPSPAAWCILEHPKAGKKIYKLFASEKTTIKHENTNSIQTTKNGILFPCQDAYLLVTELQIEGKKRMKAKEFLVGNSMLNWTISTQK